MGAVRGDEEADNENKKLNRTKQDVEEEMDVAGGRSRQQGPVY